MRKDQRSKSNRLNKTSSSLTMWYPANKILIGECKSLRQTDSSDTDDNSPPKEPEDHQYYFHPSSKLKKKLLPTLLPSRYIRLNEVPAMPLHLRKNIPRRPRILKAVYCNKPDPKNYIERITDSSSEDESESPLKAIRLSTYYKTNFLLRPKSASSAFPRASKYFRSGRTSENNTGIPQYPIPSSADEFSSSRLISSSATPTLPEQGEFNVEKADTLNEFGTNSSSTTKIAQLPIQHNQEIDRMLLEDAVNRLLGYKEPKVRKVSKYNQHSAKKNIN